jgi:hypothetical protein
VPKPSGDRAAARAKIARMRAEAARRRRRRNWMIGIGGVVVAAGAAVGIALAATGGAKHPGSGGAPQLKLASLSTLGSLRPVSSPGPAGPEGVPIPAAPALASPASGATGSTVDGINCETSEQTQFHNHAQGQSTPTGTFITGGTCLYWLHTHAADGIIHIESPVHRTFTLGDFFSEWGQPLSANQVGPAHGKVTALYNGKVYLGNPAGIPLNAHAQIQLEVGTPLVAPSVITFPGSL